MTNRHFDKMIKSRLESFQPTYQRRDWLDLSDRLDRHENKKPCPSHTMYRNKRKRLKRD
jgi:hypothetical protein